MTSPIVVLERKDFGNDWGERTWDRVSGQGGTSSSVRRILKSGGRGGGRNFKKFEKNKDNNENWFTQNQSDFLPKIR